MLDLLANILPVLLFAAGSASIVLQVIFWVILLLVVIGVFVPDSSWPHITQARWGIAVVLFIILGIAVFGNPTS